MYEDTWQTEPADDYSPDRFYTRATDKKGHSETVHLKIPPELASAIAHIVQSRAIPEYRTSQDMIRDAIFHRLRYLRESGLLDSRMVTVVGFEEFAQDLFTFEERMEAFGETIRQAEEWVRKLGWNSAEARDMVGKLYAKALAIQDSEYWRNKYVEEIERKFGSLLED